MTNLSALEERMGIAFKHPDLLRRALTHRSYLNEHPEITSDNERLEFLGDAVLDFVTAAYLYRRYPHMREGTLTRLRAALVRTEQLAVQSRRFDVGREVMIGKGEEESGGNSRDALLCGTFEAIIGAFYIDSGVEAVQQLIDSLFAPVAEHILKQQTHMDDRSQLQEWAQDSMRETPQYITVDESGPDHAKEFVIDVIIGGTCYGSGRGSSKQQAAQKAAGDALKKIDYEVK
jgi:ribonuclease-3